MISGDGETVPFQEDLYPKGNVEDWLLEVERVMRDSLRTLLEKALKAYPEVRLRNYTHAQTLTCIPRGEAKKLHPRTNLDMYTPR